MQEDDHLLERLVTANATVRGSDSLSTPGSDDVLRRRTAVPRDIHRDGALHISRARPLPPHRVFPAHHDPRVRRQDQRVRSIPRRSTS